LSDRMVMACCWRRAALDMPKFYHLRASTCKHGHQKSTVT
jgi:hypothetical protein